MDVIAGLAKSTWGRLSSAFVAPPLEDPEKPHLRVGLIGGEIPIFPPLAMLLFSGGGFLGWYITQDQKAFLPKDSPVSSVPFRAITCGILTLVGLKKAKACNEELEKAGTVANFEPVPKVCDTGPFATSRNMMYLALMVVPVVESVAANSAWLLYSALGLAIYLDRIVVRAEEKFLKSLFGESYEDYCKRVPRWLFW